MSYISLYRKYRPDTFENVIGQQPIVQTLKNQLKNNMVSHAYLFTGTRGTGKTSTARILARAVNCLNPVGGSPCGKCSNCMELSKPNNLDIIELDAASNNTVDAIRELCDKTIYTPAVVRFKVFIIDEVHMLSGSAYNALLKTLEEPPAHVIFILATTDVHKLPATILSRCLRFDFRLVSVTTLADNIRRIFAAEGVTYEEEAVKLIAVAAEGSVRDSLSIADKCIAYDKNLTYEKVLEILGASNPHQIVEMLGFIADGDIGGALNSVNKLASLGKNMATIAKDLSNSLSNVLYIKNCSATENSLGVPKTIFDELKQLSLKLDNSRILTIMDLLNNVVGELKYTTQPRILLEAAIIRSITEKDNNVQVLAQKVKQLEAKLASIGQGIAEQKPAVQPIKVTQAETAKTPAPTAESPKAEEKKSFPNLTIEELWKKLILTLIEQKYALLGGTLRLMPMPKIEGDTVYLPVSDYNTRTLFSSTAQRKLLADTLLELSGKQFKFAVVEDSGDNAEKNSEITDKLKVLFEDKLKISK